MLLCHSNRVYFQSFVLHALLPPRIHQNGINFPSNVHSLVVLDWCLGNYLAFIKWLRCTVLTFYGFTSSSEWISFELILWVPSVCCVGPERLWRWGWHTGALTARAPWLAHGFPFIASLSWPVQRWRDWQEENLQLSWRFASVGRTCCSVWSH